MRLLICAGASGGGVYPALAVLQKLDNDDDVQAVLWVGGQGGMEEELVKRASVPFRAIPAAGVHGVGARALPGNLVRLGRGVLAARRVLEDFRPDALFFTGGFVAVPVALAGRGVPSVLFVPDLEPGLALRVLARSADHIAVSAEESRAHLPSGQRVTVTGYPVREEILRWGRERAVEALGLAHGLSTLLVFGGSKGARSLNQALIPALPELLADMQIVHLSGELDWPQVKEARQKLSGTLADRYRAFPYLHEEMGAALASADLVLARAGASTLGEFPAFGLPAVLVPYPHAWRYQRTNAGYLERRGAAVVLENAELADRLVDVVRELMADVPRRQAMGAAMAALAKPDAANRIAEILLSMTSTRDDEVSTYGQS